MWVLFIHTVLSLSNSVSTFSFMMQDRNELDKHNLMLMCVIFIVHQHVSTITKPSVAISSA